MRHKWKRWVAPRFNYHQPRRGIRYQKCIKCGVEGSTKYFEFMAGRTPCKEAAQKEAGRLP